MSEEKEVKERCKWCGKLYKDVSRHLPHCPVYKLQKEADEHTQDLEITKGKTQEINVPASATAQIQPTQFWIWTEGLGVQMGVMIGHLNDMREFCGNVMKLLREQLFALNSGMADQIDLLKEIVKYEKERKFIADELETKVDNLMEDITATEPKPTFKKVESEPKQSQADADFEAYEEMQRQEAKEKEVTSYKDEITLPEGTRQLEGAITITTEKAFEIAFANGSQVWIPKSTIHGTTKEGGQNQTFVIDSWVLKKNGVIGADD